ALPAADAHELWRAGMLHDVGRVGVSAGIWGKPGALTEREWEKVRLHSYYTERVLARPDTLARLGRLAASGHERLDGGGYHRRAGASMLAPGARILAAADAYCAMGEARPPPRRRRRAERARGRRAPIAGLETRSRGGTDRTRSRGTAAARARAPHQAHRAPARYLGQDGGQPHSAHLREDRRHHARRRHALRDGKASAVAVIARA